MTKIKKEMTKETYTKRAIIMNLTGVKRDVIGALLKEEARYSLDEVEKIYNDFLEGGK